MDLCNQWQKVSTVSVSVCTFVAEGSSVRRLSTVAGETVGFFLTATLVLAQQAIAAAVAWASR